MLESDGRARSPLPGAAGEQLPISTSAVPVLTTNHPPRMTKVISFDNLEAPIRPVDHRPEDHPLT
jgi:hypothetical protein